MDRPRRSAKPVQRFGDSTTSSTFARDLSDAAPIAKRTRAMNQDEADEEGGSSSEESESMSDGGDGCYGSSRPKKRVRRKTAVQQATPVKGARKGKGKLCMFAEMPLDVLLEVARYVDPTSVIALSRTNKATRSALTAKSAGRVWTSVREATGLPAMTTGKMTDREVLLFVYDKKCMVCHEAPGPIIDYIFKIRLCKSCETKTIVPVYDIRGRNGASVDSTTATYFLKAHVPVGRDALKRYTFLPAANALLKQVRQLKGASGAQLEESTAGRFAHQVAAEQDGRALQAFLMAESAARRDESKKLEAARKAAIIARVVELGFEKRDLLAASTIDNLIYQPRALTDAIWKRISSAVIAAVDEQRDARLAREEEEKRQAELQEELRKKREAERKILVQQQELERIRYLAAEAQRLAAKIAPAIAKVEAELSLPASTLHARYASLLPKQVTLSPTNQDVYSRCIKNPSTSLTRDEYTSLFAPYLHYFSCRFEDCRDDRELFSLDDFLKHKASKHGIVDDPKIEHFDPLGHTLHTFSDENWTDTLAGALKEAGLALDIGGKEAVEKLEALGEVWCINRHDQRRYKWSEMIADVFRRYRGIGETRRLRLDYIVKLELDRSIPSAPNLASSPSFHGTASPTISSPSPSASPSASKSSDLPSAAPMQLKGTTPSSDASPSSAAKPSDNDFSSMALDETNDSSEPFPLDPEKPSNLYLLSKRHRTSSSSSSPMQAAFVGGSPSTSAKQEEDTSTVKPESKGASFIKQHQADDASVKQEQEDGSSVKQEREEASSAKQEEVHK